MSHFPSLYLKRGQNISFSFLAYIQFMIILSRAITLYNIKNVMRHPKNHLKRTPLFICLSACPSVSPTVYIQYICIHTSIHQSDRYMYVSMTTLLCSPSLPLQNIWQDTTLRTTQLAAVKCFYSDCNIAHAYNGVTACEAVQHLLAVPTNSDNS
jgi:hypothetical protein